MKIAFTGHRPHKLHGKHNEIVLAMISMLTEQEPELTFVGMAQGVDMLAGAVCRKFGYPYEAAIPFLGHESKFSASEQEHYKTLISDAKSVHICCEGDYKVWYFQVRNEYMVDNSDVLYAVWDGSSGGTANCIKYAKKIGRPIFYFCWETGKWVADFSSVRGLPEER